MTAITFVECGSSSLRIHHWWTYCARLTALLHGHDFCRLLGGVSPHRRPSFFPTGIWTTSTSENRGGKYRDLPVILSSEFNEASPSRRLLPVAVMANTILRQRLWVWLRAFFSAWAVASNNLWIFYIWYACKFLGWNSGGRLLWFRI